MYGLKPAPFRAETRAAVVWSQVSESRPGAPGLCFWEAALSMPGPRMKRLPVPTGRSDQRPWALGGVVRRERKVAPVFHPADLDLSAGTPVCARRGARALSGRVM